jgi:2-polyprenyl-6-methoxyphenol hydroxylase-like FAD-dependent oxidoreductase
MTHSGKGSGGAEVLVVGAGPVGLTAALALVRGGVRVDVAEARAALGSESLAATFHPPTLQILADLGVGLAGRGLEARTIGFRSAESPVRTRFSLAELAAETAHPYRRHIPQLQVCRLMLDRLRQSGLCRVRFGQRVTPQSIRGYRWVFAADGADSGLRNAAGIGFSGESYAGTVVRLLCDPAGFEGWDPVTYVATPSESVSVLRMADHIRVIARMPDGTADLEAAAVRVATRATGVRPVVRSWSPYRSRRMMIATNLVDNVIFVGDSAHVTTTRGGMNMNAGIHDAAVIATALARDPGCLADAAAARLAVARDLLLPRTHETLDDPMARFRRVLALSTEPGARLDFLRRGAMLDMVNWP